LLLVEFLNVEWQFEHFSECVSKFNQVVNRFKGFEYNYNIDIAGIVVPAEKGAEQVSARYSVGFAQPLLEPLNLVHSAPPNDLRHIRRELMVAVIDGFVLQVSREGINVCQPRLEAWSVLRWDQILMIMNQLRDLLVVLANLVTRASPN
jgi:hypothetical protein